MAQQDWISKDFYGVLGLTKKASADEIKKAYRKLSRQYHPDLHPNDKQAEAKYKDITEAYSVLKDPKQKQEYDAVRAFGGGGARFNAGSGGGGFSDMFSGMFGGGGGGSRTTFTSTGGGFEDLFGGGASGGQSGFSFSDLFGGGGSSGFSGQRYQPQPSAPKEKNASIKITFDQAVNGVKVKVMDKQVQVPAGINDGQTIRAKINGTTVNIKVSVKPNELYSLDGGNIVMDLPVTIAEAALGTTVEVPLYPTGTTKIKVPAGIQNGQMLRVKGKGVPAKNGDLLLKIQVKVPEKLTKKQKDALKEFQANEKDNPRQW